MWNWETQNQITNLTEYLRPKCCITCHSVNPIPSSYPGWCGLISQKWAANIHDKWWQHHISLVIVARKLQICKAYKSSPQVSSPNVWVVFVFMTQHVSLNRKEHDLIRQIWWNGPLASFQQLHTNHTRKKDCLSKNSEISLQLTSNFCCLTVAHQNCLAVNWSCNLRCPNE